MIALEGVSLVMPVAIDAVSQWSPSSPVTLRSPITCIRRVAQVPKLGPDEVTEAIVP